MHYRCNADDWPPKDPLFEEIRYQRGGRLLEILSELYKHKDDSQPIDAKITHPDIDLNEVFSLDKILDVAVSMVGENNWDDDPVELVKWLTISPFFKQLDGPWLELTEAANKSVVWYIVRRSFSPTPEEKAEQEARRARENARRDAISKHYMEEPNRLSLLLSKYLHGRVPITQSELVKKIFDYHQFLQEHFPDKINQEIDSILEYGYIGLEDEEKTCRPGYDEFYPSIDKKLFAMWSELTYYMPDVFKDTNPYQKTHDQYALHFTFSEKRPLVRQVIDYLLETDDPFGFQAFQAIVETIMVNDRDRPGLKMMEIERCFSWFIYDGDKTQWSPHFKKYFLHISQQMIQRYPEIEAEIREDFFDWAREPQSDRRNPGYWW